ERSGVEFPRAGPGMHRAARAAALCLRRCRSGFSVTLAKLEGVLHGETRLLVGDLDLDHLERQGIPIHGHATVRVSRARSLVQVGGIARNLVGSRATSAGGDIDDAAMNEIGRASCRVRVLTCQVGW